MLRQALPLARQRVGRSIGSTAKTQWRASRQNPKILEVRDLLRRELQQSLTKTCRDPTQTPNHGILILNPASTTRTPSYSQEPQVLPPKALNHRLLALSCLPHQQPIPYDRRQITLYPHRVLPSFLPALREANSRPHHLHQFLQPREYVPTPQRLLRMALLRIKALRLPQRRHSLPQNASLGGSGGRCRLYLSLLFLATLVGHIILCFRTTFTTFLLNMSPSVKMQYCILKSESSGNAFQTSLIPPTARPQIRATRSRYRAEVGCRGRLQETNIRPVIYRPKESI